MILDTTWLVYLCLSPIVIVWAIFVVLSFRMEFKLWNYRKVPGLPIFENYFVLTNLKDVLKNVMKFKQRYGDIFKINITIGMPALVISDLKILEFLLGTTQILEKSYTYSFLEKWLGHGLLTSPPEKWRKTRKILTPAFHFQILEQYVESFHSTTSILINKLKSSISKDPKTPIDIYPYITLCTLDIICETAMGTKINAQENTQSEYVKGVKELCRITVERTVNPMTMFPITYMFTKDYRIERHYLKILHNHTNSVIKRRREELIKNDHPKQKRLAFLDLLLQSTLDGKPMTDEEIREEVDTFMFAGHDTTASGISFILYCISKYPDVQQKVCDEIEEILGNDKNLIPTIKQLNEMKYLEMVIKESLRLFPPVPIFARSPLNDTSHPSGLFPTWSQLLVFVYGVHRDPKNYDDPETFDPDRFLPENQSKRHPYSYLTFSAGPRNCIGQKFAMLEMKSTVSLVLRHFILKPVEGFEPKLIPLTVLKSLNGVQVILEERK
ncbi:cytochrome P450 4d2-like [Onthophagus taurus]|uniref:cytochrome P450 4d2-like n=1 Tax=Onthophagus taurus TaxID=166361 RepID=UPI0039BDEC3C